MCNSEDDTIMEEPTFSSNKDNQMSQQKVATILRTRSCRDREILCKCKNILLIFQAILKIFIIK